MSSATFPFYVSPKPGEVAKEPMEPLAIETAPRHGLDSLTATTPIPISNRR